MSRVLLTDHGSIDVSAAAGADLSALQYHFVKLNSSNQVVAAGANEKTLGILQNVPTSGQTARVRVSGLSLLKVAEATAFGNYLTATAASKGEVADAAGEEVGARALGVYATDDLAEVQLMNFPIEATDA